MKPATWLFLIVMILSCKDNNSDFIKTESGLQYQIISDKIGDVPLQGQFIKMHVRQVYDDSVLSDTRNGLPQYMPFDTASMTKESFRIFSQVRVGDSLIFRVLSDSAFKVSRPAFAKGKGWLYTFVKVEGIMSEDSARREMEEERGKKE